MIDSDDTPTFEPLRAQGEAPPARTELSPGDCAGEYVIERLLASGGCGAVYAAEHRKLGRRVAVKLLHGELVGSPEMVERFVREARAVNMVRHPNIVDIYEFGELPDRRPYLVMELLEGRSLEALLGERGALSPADTLELIAPVCAALAAAHDVGVIHRDLKASNIFVAQRGGERVIKLLDFGIAKLVDPAGGRGLTAVGTRLGTPYAMAPEQIRVGTVDARTDVYALGILLYHLLTGRHPFEADDATEMERLHLTQPAPRPSAQAPLWPAIDDVVLRCLEKAPERRYESVPALLEALRAALSAQPGDGSRRQGRSATAVAIFVEVRLRDETAGDFDGELLDRLVEVFDQAGQVLRDAGFVIALETGSALLGARLLADDPAESRLERARALELARELAQSLAHATTESMTLGVCVHVDRAIARQQGDGEQILGGPIVNIGGWAPQDEGRGARATREAIADIDGYANAAGDERFVTLS